MQNTTGAIIILISLMKASPKGLSATACCAQKWPTNTPSRTAQRIWKYSDLASFMGITIVEIVRMRLLQMCGSGSAPGATRPTCGM
ncbi:hypothetical protein D3C72_2433020 [compost metagenome]